MAEATITSRERAHVLGDVRIDVLTIAALADTNTITYPASTRVLGAFLLSSDGKVTTLAVASPVITATVAAGPTAVKVGVLIA